MVSDGSGQPERFALIPRHNATSYKALIPSGPCPLSACSAAAGGKAHLQGQAHSAIQIDTKQDIVQMNRGIITRIFN